MAERFPDFIIVGTQKAGTTWLGARLAEQRGLFLPRPFEVHFFDRNDNYRMGPSWYASHFTAAPEGALVGEKTPDYLWTVRPHDRGPNDIPQRMHAMLPNARLVVVLRDPVRRAISALNHIVRARWLSPFVNPDAVLSEAMDPACDRYGLIGRGLYVLHLRRYLEFYPKERIHIIFFEDELIKAPQVALNALMVFLGRGSAQPIPAQARPENRGMNSRLAVILNYYAPVLTPLMSYFDRVLPTAPQLAPGADCRARLYEHFEPHNRALFEFLGRGTNAWNGAVPSANASTMLSSVGKRKTQSVSSTTYDRSAEAQQSPPNKA